MKVFLMSLSLWVMQLFIKPDNLVSAHFGTGGVLELNLGNKEIPSIVEAYGQLHRERGLYHFLQK